MVSLRRTRHPATAPTLGRAADHLWHVLLLRRRVVDVTPEELAEVREELEAFTSEMFEAFTRADQHRWGRAYARELLLDGRRKSVEPMARGWVRTATGRRWHTS
jgi:hypothetical protein